MSYGYHAHQKKYGSGENLYRTATFAQPLALEVGDILVTGDEVLAPPKLGFNGSVLITLTGGFDGHEISVPSRIPIAIRPRRKK